MRSEQEIASMALRILQVYDLCDNSEEQTVARHAFDLLAWVLELPSAMEEMHDRHHPLWREN